ncbi:MAG: 30S ribosomal protein S17 [Candidatus Shikimatogenerans bostrichidophilus]|nr:MAG: 30S ribosomal protein S17 [Candidatus Shikimatogenerans bostrichidophilus]
MMKNKKKKKKGIIISDKMNKTRIVLNNIKVKHKKYLKTIFRKKKYYVHDEKNISKKGDFVEIFQTRPLSKKKFWVINKIIKNKK